MNTKTTQFLLILIAILTTPSSFSMYLQKGLRQPSRLTKTATKRTKAAKTVRPQITRVTQKRYYSTGKGPGTPSTPETKKFLKASGDQTLFAKMKQWWQSYRGRWSPAEFERLTEAVQKDDIKTLKESINSTNINNKGKYGHTLLHDASWWSRGLEAFKFLVSIKGVDINSINDLKETPLHLASAHGSLEKVMILVEHGANVNADRASFLDGYTPLHNAISDVDLKQSMKKVIFLVDHGANPNQRGTDGKTAMHIAAEKGRLDILNFLSSRSGKIDQTDKSGGTFRRGRTPREYFQEYIKRGKWLPSEFEQLTQVIKKNDIETLKKLVDSTNVNKTSEYKDTLLHKAAEYGNLDTVQYLLSQGAKIGSQDTWKRTPLQEAIIYRKVYNILPLIKATSRLEIDMTDYNGETALHLAAQKGLIDVYEQLKNKGANENLKDKDGITPEKYLEEALKKKRAAVSAD